MYNGRRPRHDGVLVVVRLVAEVAWNRARASVRGVVGHGGGQGVVVDVDGGVVLFGCGCRIGWVRALGCGWR
jgi:hypothetical protein